MYVVSDNCRGCGICVPSCPADALKIKNGKAEIDNNKCRVCGLCLTECPFNSITRQN